MADWSRNPELHKFEASTSLSLTLNVSHTCNAIRYVMNPECHIYRLIKIIEVLFSETQPGPKQSTIITR